jgi:Thoeris protein ThsB, TIR-like domain
VEFVGRHLLDPVHSTDNDYITRKINKQLHRSSVTLVLIETHTTKSDRVTKEIRWSADKGNGILGINLKGHADAPVPNPLQDCGAEIINWNPDEFTDAIERAARAAGRAAALASSGPASGGTCAR